MIERMAPPEDIVFAEQFVETLQKRDSRAAEALLAPEAMQDGGPGLIPALMEVVPDDPPISIAPQGWHRLRRTDFQQVEMTFEYTFPGERWLMVEMVFVRRSNGAPLVRAVRLSPLPMPLREINAFKLEGKPLSAYLVAIATLAVFALIGLSLIVCLFSASPRWWWKIVWCLAMFSGTGVVLAEWTTGAISLDPVQFSWLSMSIGRLGPDGPYYFETVFPIGVAAYWIWRRARTQVVARPTENAARID